MEGRVSGGAGNGESIFGLLKDPCAEDCGEWVLKMAIIARGKDELS